MTIFQRIKRNGRGEYVQNEREAEYTVKFQWHGKTYVRKTGKTDPDQARRVADKLLKELQENRVTDILAATRARADRTTAHLIQDYLTAGCPDRRLQPRVGTALDNETRNLTWIEQYFGPTDPAAIKPTHSAAYLAWRRSKITQKNATGKRTAELELQSLANCLTWALRDGRLDRKPELQLVLRTAKDIRHARTLMPACGDELHAIATHLFHLHQSSTNPGASETYAWLQLFQPLTGLRIGECTLLLANPKRTGLDCPPGYVDDKYLHVRREKRGINPRIRLDDPERPHLRPLIEMIRAWHALRFPTSPWLFPNADGTQLDPRNLTNALTRACHTLQIPHRTSHGNRAYYCTARLAQGLDIEDVARELGQRSGEDLVRHIYSLDLDQFQADTFRSLKDTLTWLPNSPDRQPAWTWWTTQATNIIPLAAS